MKTSQLITYSVFLLLFAVSCEEPICLFPKEPELDNKEFPVGNTEVYYYVDLNAEINNEPRDDDYDYYFDVEGLPLGMDYFVNYRTISIEGITLESGTFEIVIYVDVDGPFNNFNEEPDLLCNYHTSKKYLLIIE